MMLLTARAEAVEGLEVQEQQDLVEALWMLGLSSEWRK